jgi:WD40 repeat protein/tRNA A-37 threonylcarbamoyl transferase component Bud32
MTPDADRDERLNLAVAAYLEAAEHGPAPASAEWLARYPDLRPELTEFFAARGDVEGVAAPLRRLLLRPASHSFVRALPTHFAGYELLEELGAGGMGVVYKARQFQPPRIVALKMIRAGRFASAVERLRFRTGAEATALLRHPRIVPVLECGESEGQAYLTMPLVEGGTLTARLPDLLHRPREATQLVLPLAEAVQHAHDRGVLHRDLKPSNILLDADGRPHIADFGLAKLAGADSDVTHTGELLGALPYMAPEQAEGKRGAATTATDVYGLGAILYACLTGEPPHRGEHLTDVLARVRTREPEPPHRVNPRVPRDLSAVCLKCLEKDPSRRYASAAAVADDLRRFLYGRPTAARPVGRLARTARWARRNPALAGLTAVAIAAVLAAVGVGGWLSFRLAVSRAETQAAEQVAATQEFFTILERARQRRLDPRPGWTRESLADLHRAGALPPAADYLLELRTEAAACLSGVDPRPVRTFSDDFPVYAVAYSPDGRRLALGRYSPDGVVGRVRLVDPDDGTVARELTYAADTTLVRFDKPDGCRRLAFSPDGRWLVAASSHNVLHRWDLTSNDTHAASWQPIGPPAHLAFGVVRPLLFTSDSEVIQCWDLVDAWKEVRRWQADFVSRPAVDPGTGRIAFCFHKRTPSLDTRMHLLDGATLEPCRPPLPVSIFTPMTGIQLASPFGRVVLANSDRKLILADPESGQVLRSLTVPDGEDADAVEVTDVVFSPDGRLLASASEWSRRLRFWDVVRGRLLADIAAGDSGSMRLAFRPDGRSLVVAADRKAVVYEVTGADVASAVALQPHPPAAAGLAADGRSLVCLAENRWNHTVQAACWPLRSEASIRPTLWLERPDPPTNNRSVIAVGRLGGLVFTANGGLEFRPAAVGQPSEALPIESLKSLAFGPDGRVWAAAGHKIRAFALPGWRESARWANSQEDEDAGRVFITVAPGATCVLAGRRDGKVFQFDPAGGLHARWSVGGDLPVSALALHEPAGIVAAGDEAGRVRIFHVPTGNILADLPQAHRDAIGAAALSPDGQLLSTGGRDRAIRLWRRDGTAVLTLPTLGSVIMLAFSPGGEELFALVDGERGVRRWHLGRLAVRLRDLGIEPGFEASAR